MATLPAGGAGDRALSVQEITKEAGNFEYDADIPMGQWLRTADMLQKQAQSYEQHGNDQVTYLFLLRHAMLVLEKLSQHPEAKEPDNRDALKKANKVVNQNMARMEALRPKINERHKKYTEFVARRKDDRQKMASLAANPSTDAALAQRLNAMLLNAGPESDAGLYSQVKSLDAGKHRELAVKLAHREIKKRDSAREAVRQRDQHRMGHQNDAEDESESVQRDVDELAQKIIAAQRRGDQTFTDRNGTRSPGSTTFRPATPHYPDVPQKSAYEIWGETQMKALPPSATKQPPPKGMLRMPGAPSRGVPPKPPLKEPAPQSSPYPPRPEKVFESDSSEPVSRSLSATPPQHDLNPRNYTFKPAAYLENGTPLRTIFISPDIRSRFLKIAEPNTRRNLETCGMLCGTLISNAFFISKLVIPEQESTSDTCEMTNEPALVDYCETEDLMTLGWIHTHPTQTCFMSSRDLHTHVGFQVQMAESIAIVCAPSTQPSWGVFRLTDPPGKQAVLSCRQPGIFHPHAESNLYTDAVRPGHVCEVGGLEFEIVDLRPPK